MNLGQKLRILREQKGWTLTEVAAASGISVSHLSAIENGSRPNPSFSVVAKLAQTYDVSLNYFADPPEGEEAPHVSETPAVYAEIVKRLEEQHALDDPSALLEFLAHYLRNRSSSADHDE